MSFARPAADVAEIQRLRHRANAIDKRQSVELAARQHSDGWDGRAEGVKSLHSIRALRSAGERER